MSNDEDGTVQESEPQYVILDSHLCTQYVGDVEVTVDGRVDEWTKPRPYILYGRLAYYRDTSTDIPIHAMLYPGSSYSFVNYEKLLDLEKELGFMVTLERRFPEGDIFPPVADLLFILPSGHRCTSMWGIISRPRAQFDDVDADMLIGQDILSQYIITFDGPQGTLTISLPLPE